MNQAEQAVATAVSMRDLPRILALSRRPAVDCERERGSRRWKPAAQALIEVETAKYTRGPRLSCGCRDRHVIASAGGDLTVFQQGTGGLPPLPVYTTIDNFCRDNAHNVETCSTVSALRPGNSIDLPGLGYPCITSLNAVQSWALREMRRADGLLGMLGVGSGKTLLSILAPLSFRDCRQVMLLGEATQRLHYRNFYLRAREHFRVPSFILDKSDLQGQYVIPGAPVLHFRAYSMLSQAKSTDMLDQLAPDLIIADECHRVSRRTNSNTGRFVRYFAKNNDKNIRLCAWSGTLVKKSIKDISHLAAFSLGLNSPYPINPDTVEAWSAVIDPSPNPDHKSVTAKELKHAFGAKTDIQRAFFVADLIPDNDVREGLRSRVNETLGVISTKGSSASSALYLHERKAPKIPERVRDALADVRCRAVRPDGEELVDAFEIARCAREVASGFHYYWFYPEYAAAKTDQQRQVIVTKIYNWFDARKLYSKELRSKLLRQEVHLDSPMLCAHAAERAWRSPRYEGDLPVWQAESWPAWEEIKDTVQHESRTSWLDDYLARDAAAWGREHCGIIWYLNSAFGKKVAEILGVHCHGGGPEAEAAIMAENGSHSIVASIKAHGSGRDGLQHKFNEQLIAEVPSSNAIFEQLLGRLCRDGQKEDAIQTWIYLHVSENKDALRSAIREAEFVEQSTGNQQLLLMCDRSNFDL